MNADQLAHFVLLPCEHTMGCAVKKAVSVCPEQVTVGGVGKHAGLLALSFKCSYLSITQKARATSPKGDQRGPEAKLARRGGKWMASQRVTALNSRRATWFVYCALPFDEDVRS